MVLKDGCNQSYSSSLRGAKMAEQFQNKKRGKPTREDDIKLLWKGVEENGERDCWNAKKNWENLVLKKWKKNVDEWAIKWAEKWVNLVSEGVNLVEASKLETW